jgi:plastocyanin
MRGRATIALLMLAAVTAGTAAAGRAEIEGPVVTVRLFQFQPSVLTVSTATRVVWTNQDDILHTVTAVAEDAKARGFARALDGKGASTAVTFTAPGVYAYACERHPHMRGEIRVEARARRAHER